MTIIQGSASVVIDEEDDDDDEGGDEAADWTSRCHVSYTARSSQVVMARRKRTTSGPS